MSHPLLPTRAALLTAALLAACAVGPEYQHPELEMPTAWRGADDAVLDPGPVRDDAWWRTFDDPLLGELVEQALRQNLDLRASFARLDATRAQLGIAKADRWPQVDANGSYTYRRESRNTPFGAFIPRTDIHQITLDAAWELDLWGRVRRSVEAADADLQASTFDLQGAALSVAAEVARTYVDLRAAQRRLTIGRANLELQEQTLGLVQARLSAGLVGERDVAQARTNVETTRSRLPQLEAAAVTAGNRLATLLGGAPDALPADLLGSAEAARMPGIPAKIAVGAPADLLRRRPDVRRAERAFAAEVARVGAVDAERYPRFTLSGQIGLAANTAKDLFDSSSDVSGFGPSVSWNLLDGDRLKQRVLAQQATAEAARVDFEQTVRLAVEEAENAMASLVHERERRAALAAAAAEARRASELARTQYREGLSDFQAVLDSERVVATVEDDLASSDAAVAGHLIALFKALGGGLPEAAAR
jgi:NodT family efflux transporter outer membrane factor (OMF) lipoprotein